LLHDRLVQIFCGLRSPLFDAGRAGIGTGRNSGFDAGRAGIGTGRNSGRLLVLPSRVTVSSAPPFHEFDSFRKNDDPHFLAVSPPTTDFALSALKNSFSMSSLSQQRYHQLSIGGSPNNNNIIASGSNGAWNGALTPPYLQTPDAASRVKWERPFNSLTRLK
jgi:hypothetical protein